MWATGSASALGLGAGQHEAAPADYSGILAGFAVHGVDQFEVTHDRASQWKGDREHRDTGRQRSGPEEGNTPSSQRG